MCTEHCDKVQNYWLLSIKKGTYPMKKGHIFLFSKKWGGGGHRAQCPFLVRGPCTIVFFARKQIVKW